MNKDLTYEQFVRNFNDNKIAQSYLKSRKLSNKIINSNLVGYCPIYSRYSFPLLRGRLIVPIHDIENNIIAFAGRQIIKTKDEVIQSFWETFGSEPAKCQDKISKWEKGKWINEPYQKTKNLFFLNKAKKNCLLKNYIVLVEGYFDVYSLFDNGIENVSALCGTSISNYQIALALRYCDNVVVMMDSDNPGKVAANNICEKIEKAGGRSFKINLPYGCDPDDFANSYDMSFFDNAVSKMITDNKKELYIRAD